MKLNNNKGFTLVELIATIVLLSLVVGIASYSIVTIINNAKEQDEKLLIGEIKNAVEAYEQECRYGGVGINCPSEVLKNGVKYYDVSLEILVKYGYLKGNSEGSDDKFTLVNPKNGKVISSCLVRYKRESGSVKFVAAVNNSDVCLSVVD